VVLARSNSKLPSYRGIGLFIINTGYAEIQYAGIVVSFHVNSFCYQYGEISLAALKKRK